MKRGEFALCALVLACSGCGAASGPKFRAEPVPVAGAVVYVYRPYHFFSPATDPAVTCANETIEIQPGGYHAFQAKPGPVTCSANSGASVQFEARAREEYYVREEVHSGLLVNVDLQLASREDGLDEIKSCCEKQ
ncbi:MAG TPA: hypothetical protein VEJ86_06760 [Candidatus Binataceae bacterium]|nr:hypothetical protein [Candidatus Binataceae bacterium]